MSDTSRSPVAPGEILAGKYRVDQVLGVGGMGVVVAAHHIHLDDEVAIKFMLPEALKNEHAVARFAREARAAVKIKSEHVARVHDVGTLENGAPYMVMEYLRGKDLAQWLAESGSLPVDLAVDFVLQASVAVAEAHAQGIVHRDLKPANLFVFERPDGSHLVKVLDFGISKMSKEGEISDMTHTSVVMGSPLYMSPEQLRGAKNADARSDIWALGAILYELVGGEPPFVAETLPELVQKTVSESPPPLLSTRGDVPNGLEAIVLRCLAKDPSARFQSVGQMAAALARFGLERSRTSLERISGFDQSGAVPRAAVGMGSASSQAFASASAVRRETAAPWSRTGPRPPGKRAIGVVAVLAAVALVGVVVWQFRSPHPAAEGTASTDPAFSSPAAPAATPAGATAQIAEPAPPVPEAPSVAPAPLDAPAPAALTTPAAGRPAPQAAGKTKATRARPTASAAPPLPQPSQKPASTPSIDSMIDDRQ